MLGRARAQAAAPTAGAVHTVLPGQSLQAALARAADGDEVRLVAGVHRGQAAVVLQRRLTLRGVGGRVVLEAAGAHAEGKALLVVRDGDVHVEDLEFRGTRVPDRNGAGIRHEKGRLRVSRCVFRDNEMGLLTANFADAELMVEDCDFGDAPDNEASLSHLLYVGAIARLSVTGSRFSGGNRGHLLKSRARENHVRFNQLVDGASGRASYELEFPNGGLAFVVGNVLGQAPDTGNPVLLAFGAEGERDRRNPREHALHVVHNTFLNFARRPAVFVRVAEDRLAGPVEQRLANNLFLGLGVPELALGDLAQGNVLAALSTLPEAATGDYRLRPDSLLRGRGVEPGSARGVDLRPLAAFTPPVGTRAVPAPARWSPGAYQE